MKKIAIYFTNDNGSYYIENVALFTGDKIPETEYKHRPARIIDETLDWRNYERTKGELSNPTTINGAVFVVVQQLNQSIILEI